MERDYFGTISPLQYRHCNAANGTLQSTTINTEIDTLEKVRCFDDNDREVRETLIIFQHC